MSRIAGEDALVGFALTTQIATASTAVAMSASTASSSTTSQRVRPSTHVKMVESCPLVTVIPLPPLDALLLTRRRPSDVNANQRWLASAARRPPVSTRLVRFAASERQPQGNFRRSLCVTAVGGGAHAGGCPGGATEPARGRPHIARC